MALGKIRLCTGVITERLAAGTRSLNIRHFLKNYRAWCGNCLSDGGARPLNVVSEK